MAKFGDRLRELRIEKGCSQEEIAKIFKSSRSRISMYEQGAREPDFEVLETLADYFNVDMDYLLGKTSIKRRFNLFSDTSNFNSEYEEAMRLYSKYKKASLKTRNIVDQLLEEGE